MEIQRLTENELNRYTRQIILPDVGISGQIKIRTAKILVVGLGGLGSPVLMYLCSAGVSRIGIVDYDRLEIHNLQRQIIHKEKYVGRPKTESAMDFVRKFNSSIVVEEYQEKLSNENIYNIADKYDILVDCTDSIDCRYVISDYCKKTDKSMVLASVLRFSGQVFVLPQGSPCFRCIFPKKKDNTEGCDDAGIFGALCGIIGSIQALEVLKIVLRKSSPSMIIYDGLKNDFRRIKLRNRYPDCLSIAEPSKEVHGVDLVRKHIYLSWEEYIKNKDAYVLVDVRPINIFGLWHIEGSINVPMDKIEVANFPKGEAILLVCNKGITASKAWNVLNKKVERVFVAEGGIESFKKKIGSSGIL